MTVELTAGLSVDEFLDRSFDSECELLGGETRPKPLGTGKHSKMQRRLLRLLEGVFGEGRVEFELSVRMGDEVPVPDLVVLQSDSPRMYRDVLDEPPLLLRGSCVAVAAACRDAGQMRTLQGIRCRFLLGGGSGQPPGVGI
jgi:Uma2 family endonuclease